jgi:predicted phosphodiesterase
MKIAVFTDLHANYPALKAFLQHIEGDEYDKIIHLGDAIAIGPNPRECMETLVDIANIHFVMGNHDDWYANG